MNYKTYCDKIQEGADHYNNERYAEAIACFQEMYDSDISDIDKSLMCNNIAATCEKMGYPDRAMEWYDEGVRLETPYSRCKILGYKAGSLYNMGRNAEAIAIYERILTLPYATEEEKQNAWNYATLLKNQRP